MKNILQKNDPFLTEMCKGKEKEKCLPCKSLNKNEKESNCKKNNIGYKIPCITCEKRGITKVYEGESSRNAKIKQEKSTRGGSKRKKRAIHYSSTK